MNNVLKFGIPKGSLEEATVDLFRKAGWRWDASGEGSGKSEIVPSPLPCDLSQARCFIQFSFGTSAINPSPCAALIGPSQIYLGGFAAWSCYCASGWGRVTLSGSVPVPYGSVKRALR